MSAVQQWQLVSALLAASGLFLSIAWMFAREEVRHWRKLHLEAEGKLKMAIDENDRLRDCLAKMRPFPPS